MTAEAHARSTAAAGLEVEATLIRGGFRAEISLTVKRGGVLSLLGPNGAGKSSVLRAIAGLDPIAAGTIRVDGKTVADPAGEVSVPVRERNVGYVFQDYRLFPHLDVLDNVAFGIRSGGASRRAARTGAAEVLERTALEHFSKAMPDELSGGEAQRVAVARALAGGPRLLLLDEPLAALDVENRSAMRGHLARAIENFDATVLLVSHDPGDALAVSGRIAIIEEGRIVQRGTGRDLAAAPATAWVARLVGRTGISGEIPAGTRVEPGGELEFRSAAGPVRGRSSGLMPGDRFPPGPVFASFNPAAVRLEAPGGVSQVPNYWPQARITGVEHGLGQTVFDLDLTPERPDPASIRVAVSPERARQLGAGDRVTAEIPPDTVRVTPVPF